MSNGNLPENWTRHKAPTGHFYYHNSVTEESTYTRPKPLRRGKKSNHQDTPEAGTPVFKLSLPSTDWELILTTKGTHFFHDRATGRSSWTVDDDKIRESVSAMDKQLLLLLVSKARGLELDEEHEGKAQELLHPVRKNELMDVENAEEKNDDEEEISVQEGQKPAATLIGGYSSSSEDSEEEEEEEEEDEDHQEPTSTVSVHPTEPHIELEHPPVEINNTEPITDSSDNENGLDLADLEGIATDDEDQEEANTIFLGLLDSSELDPYKPWEVESQRIVDDPRFFIISDNKTRRQLYDQWSSTKLKSSSYNAKPVVKIHPLVEFIRFLENSDLERLFTDFKKKYGEELNKLQLGDRDKERVYREYVIFMKRPQSDRENLFRSLISSAKIFKKNVLESQAMERLEQLNMDDLPSLSDDQVYIILHDIEDWISLSDSIKLSTKHYLVDVRRRIQLLREMALEILR